MIQPPNAFKSFKDGLRAIALSWRDDPMRPVTTPEVRAHWNDLINAWCDCVDIPLPIRKSGNRGLLYKHPTGRSYVLSDNSPAHWAFMGCFSGAMPTLHEVREQMESGVFPFSFARSRSEKSALATGEQLSYGGFLGSSRYGQVNKFPDGKQYKLCHLKPVGLKARGEVQDFSLDELKDHVRRLMNPSNMIVVPLEYAGVGECAAFLEPFMEHIP